MISPEILEKLEYFKILNYASRYCTTESGRNLFIDSLPIYSKDAIVIAGKLVDEAKNALIHNDHPPLQYIPALYEEIEKSSVPGMILSKEAVLAILSLIEVSRRLSIYLKNSEMPMIKSTFIEQLINDKVLEKSISDIFDEQGEIASSASPKLKEIRNSIRNKTDELMRKMNSILRKLSEGSIVQEEFITQREGRMVIPVKSEHKRQVKGFIHSESASGQTIYIEPAETLEINNDLISLSFEERREIDKILERITKKIADNKLLLSSSLNTVAEIDMIFAKASFSVEIEGAFPEINDGNIFEIIQGKHPGLLKKLGKGKTVPLDFKITSDKKVLIITGPNAGGKTVVLKTAGLLCALVQAGFHVPVHPDSNFKVFRKILLDIGDSQSIEDDLSTFSSHLLNIKNILNDADENSLVLLDEIGTGTDPTEGAALAGSVLLALENKGAYVFATTHHGNLKVMADCTIGFQNASMEFDNEKLLPTYKFRQGIPGSSYAFEIAGRIGLEQYIIDEAVKRMQGEKLQIEQFIARLDDKMKLLDNKLKQADIENLRLKGLTKIYDEKLAAINEKKKQILEKTKNETERFISEVNSRIENAIKEIRQSNADKDVIKKERKIISDKIELYKSKNKEAEKDSEKVNYELKTGDYVQLKGTSTYGAIISLDKAKGKAVITSGTMKMTLEISKLILSRKKEDSSNSNIYSNFVTQLPGLRIDIRGRKPEDAEMDVLRFIDEAYISGYDRIEILHGRGTGVLKQFIKELLQKQSNINKFYFADLETGGDGITIVELK